MTKHVRNIVTIDADKCNGCGDCVPSCAEGAIQIIDGKAVLLAENLCDGIGNCLGTCPMDAIHIEQREVDEFDESAVEQHLQKTAPSPCASQAPAPHTGGCPGSMMRSFQPTDAPKSPTTQKRASQLRQWPVQLYLLPQGGPIWQDADVLLAADCSAFAMGNFHDEILEGKTLAIACPKLDDTNHYLDKLTTIFRDNSIRSVTVTRMEVPCCGGLTTLAQQALAAAGKTDVPLKIIVLAVDGSSYHVETL